MGFSLAVLLGQQKQVNIFDIDNSKIDKINQNLSPIKDNTISGYLKDKSKNINLKAFKNLKQSIKCADLIIIALPTNFNDSKNYFDTQIIESTLLDLFKNCCSVPVLIKSTVPIGFTKKMSLLYPNESIIYSPEFLREGSALEDNINPSRIIIGSDSPLGKEIADLFFSFTANQPNILFMNSSEAEASKLFSNAYLANRISFFNELDSFALENELDTKTIIEGVSSDPRIGMYYNNPSFGYGGYCLPKDTKQLEAQCKTISQEIISATIRSNNKRKNFIAQHILSKNYNCIGIYRLSMKKDSDNFREASVLEIIKIIKKTNPTINILVYEPNIEEIKFLDCQLITSKYDFIDMSQIILANRIDSFISTIKNKLFTRDIYQLN